MRVMNEALKIAHLKRPNISIKLNDAFVVYFRLHGRLKHLFTKLLLTGGR